MKTNKYTLYETEKERLKQLNLSFEEYEKALKALAKKLKI